MTTTGTLTDEAELLTGAPSEPMETSGEVSLHHEMVCIIMETARDRRDGLIKPGVTQAEASALAADLVRRLAPCIGGRYITKRDEKAARDAAVWREFNGRNHVELMRKHQISRRLFYSIIARMRKVQKF